MNDKTYHEYKREELEVGMTVAEPTQIIYGWRRIFRYPIWRKTKIKAMTPKKMKITLENGHVIEVKKDLYREKTGFFEFDYSMEKETAVARAIQDAWKYQNEIAALHFENINDDNICAVAEKLKEVIDLAKREEK